jgi:ssDNA thymidine ADP-ribosyltransferase, DarT
MPNGGVVNDFVPFYFSPITSFTYTIYKRNVPLVSPTGQALGQASEDDRIFFVARPDSFRGSNLYYCFSDHALNSNVPIPQIETNLDRLESHVFWNVFDESLDKASISEIGYMGVCRWFKNMESPAQRMTRSPKRMAEFLVLDAVPLEHVVCIIAKTDIMRDKLLEMMNASAWNIPIYTKRGCYFG